RGEPQGGNEQRAGQQDQQPDGQVAPQDGEVEAREAAVLGRDGSDAPHRGLPFQGPLETFGDGGHHRHPARCRTTGAATFLSSTGPRRSNETGTAPATLTASSLTRTSPGPACPAMRAATLTVRPK